MVICPGSPWAGGLGCRWGAGLGNGPKVLCPFPGAGVTKHRRLGGLDPELHLLPVLEAGRPGSRGGQGEILSGPGPSPAAGRLLEPFGSEHRLDVCLCVHVVSPSLQVPVSENFFFFLIRTRIRFRPVQLQPDLIQSVSSAATLFPNKFTF